MRTTDEVKSEKDVDWVIRKSTTGLGQRYKGGNLRIFADGHYEGHGVYDNGWNRAPDWAIYFCWLRIFFVSVLCLGEILLTVVNSRWVL